MGFIIGDGRLDHYRPENIVDADRGPVSAGTIRLHWER
jgi:hypothetical protein